MAAGVGAVAALTPGIAAAQDPDGDDQGKKQRWIKHRIIAGDTLDEIADRYGVTKASLIRWNKLDAKRPVIVAGRTMRVYAKRFPLPREEIVYEVQKGDTWYDIAKAHGTTVDLLKRWNKKVPRAFRAGTKLTIWIEPEPPKPATADGEGAGDEPPLALTLAPVPGNGVSTGRPNAGRLRNGVQMPPNDELYSVLRPENCYGSSHTVSTLQLAIARWRRSSGYEGKLVISAISRPGGGRFRPHRSHQNGRDVDIRLPVKAGISDTVAGSTSEVDWDATWALMAELIATEQVVYIFLERSRQHHLYKAARRAGADPKLLDRAIQYPRAGGTNYGIVRHARGHTVHMHVRFKCGPKDRGCEDGV